MGWTSENVAKDFNITREEQDIFAAESFQKAENAQKNGYFAKEIVPFTVFKKGQESNKKVPIVVREDDGIRYGTTGETLSKIKSAFPQWGNGTTTGGNASQITDGAAAVLLMTRREAERRGLPILGKYITTAVSGGVCQVFSQPNSLNRHFQSRRSTAHHGRRASIRNSSGTKERRLGIKGY